jgi:hypothetical protein
MTGIDFGNKDVQLKKIILGNRHIVAYCSNPLLLALILIITIFLIIIYVADCKVGKMKGKKIFNIFIFSYLISVCLLFFNNTILCHQLIKKNENVIHDEFEELMRDNSINLSNKTYNQVIGVETVNSV